MRYLAFSPFELSLDEALLAVAHNDSLVENAVTLVSKRYDGGYNYRSCLFQNEKARSYGYDLYLYQIDSNGENKFLDSCISD